MAIIKCPECGHQVSDHARTCPSCGIDIAGNIVRCPECGELAFAFQEMCPNCHHALKAPVVVEPKQVRYESERQEKTARPQQFVAQQPEKAPESTKKDRHPVAIAFVVAMVASLAIVFLGIYLMDKMDEQNEVEAYERAISSNEMLIMQDYLLRYQTAPRERRDSVEAVLHRLQKIEADWQAAIDSKDRAKIMTFVNNNPQSKHVKEARLTVDSLDWIKACEGNSIASYEAYLKEYANQGEHSDEATMKMEEIKARQEAAEKARKDSIAAEEAKRNVEQAKPVENKKPETKKPETKKPETKKPETKKPETKKPETKKPENKKPETKKK